MPPGFEAAPPGTRSPRLSRIFRLREVSDKSIKSVRLRKNIYLYYNISDLVRQAEVLRSQVRRAVP